MAERPFPGLPGAKARPPRTVGPHGRASPAPPRRRMGPEVGTHLPTWPGLGLGTQGHTEPAWSLGGAADGPGAWSPGSVNTCAFSLSRLFRPRTVSGSVDFRPRLSEDFLHGRWGTGPRGRAGLPAWLPHSLRPVASLAGVVAPCSCPGDGSISAPEQGSPRRLSGGAPGASGALWPQLPAG